MMGTDVAAAVGERGGFARASEQLLGLFIEHAPVAMAMFDRTMRYLCCSRRWLADYELGERDLRGLSHYDVFPEIPEAWKAAHRRGLAGEVVRGEFDRFERADGSVQLLQWEIWPWFDSTGAIGGIVIFTEDITDAFRAREAHQEETLRLQMAARAGNVGLWDWDLRTDKVFFSPEWKSQIGYEDHEIPGDYREWEARLHPDDRDRTLDLLRRSMENPAGGYSIEFRLRHKDGSYRLILAQGSLVYDDRGKPVRMMGSHVDITERKRAEEALRGSERRFHALVDNFSQGVVIRSDTGIRYANLAAAKMFGYEKPSDIIAVDSFFSLFASKEHARLTDYYHRRIAGQFAPADYEAEGRKKDGSRILVNIRAFRIDWEEKPGICLVLFDVTEQKEIQEKLRQAQKMEALGNLTGGMAHDFNNFLAIVIGNLDLVKARLAGDSEAEQLVGNALHGALHGAELIKHLLAFSRRQPLDLQITDVGAHIAKAMRLFGRILGEDIVLKVAAPSDTWPVLIDRAQLDSCMMNLANNARDAMPKGGELAISVGNVRLDAKCAAKNPGTAVGDHVLVEMADTGSGMSPEVLARVFDPFFTTKDSGRGTGLGMSMVYGFVKQSHGHIDIRSEVGKGTTVRIYLPRAAETRAAAAPTQATSLEQLKGQETVLVVDDNAGVRKTVLAQLASLGYRSISAENGEAALAILNRSDQPVDLLFTDVVMPGKFNGLDLARLAVERRPGLKVVLTSGFWGNLPGDDDGMRQWRLLGKPYRIGDLARALREALDSIPTKSVNNSGGKGSGGQRAD